MTCNVCNLNKDLYLYTKNDLVYSLCNSCLRVQEQIDEINQYQRRLNNILKDAE